MENLQNRESENIIAAWKYCHKQLTKSRQSSTHYILDNECSAKFNDILKEEYIYVELVSPY